MQSPELKKTISRKRCLVCDRQFPLADGEKSCPSDGSLLIPVVEDPFLGLVLDNKYEIETLIGAGGWSRVYRARHLGLEQTVAVKILDAELVDDPVHISHFQTEAKASNALAHPNIVRVYDHGVLPQPFIVMEYIEGKTLAQVLDESGILAPEVALPIFSKVCQAMDYAHAKGFVHRDLTLRNIMTTSETGDVKVLDFGLVSVNGQKLTQTGETLGSPPYMSPEQCRGDKLDQRSDIYSLGCVMYAALTGKGAFEGQTFVESMYKHLNLIPPLLTQTRADLKFPRGLEIVVAKAMAKEKDERYRSMKALDADLERVKAGTQLIKIFLTKIPNYRQSIKFVARVAMIGDITAAALFLGYLLLVAIH